MKKIGQKKQWVADEMQKSDTEMETNQQRKNISSTNLPRTYPITPLNWNLNLLKESSVSSRKGECCKKTRILNTQFLSSGCETPDKHDFSDLFNREDQRGLKTPHEKE